MKKFITVLLVILGIFTGCSKEKKEEFPKVLNLTYVKAPLNIPSILGRNDKIFENEFAKEGTEVKFYELTTGPEQIQALASGQMDFLYALSAPSALIGASNGVNLKEGTEVKFYELTTGPEQIQALASGQMDFLYALSAPSALIGASNGVNLKLTGVYTRAPKVFMILTKDENIKSPKDFVGKKIVGPKGTILHQLLVTYLNTENVSVDDTEFVNMGLPGAMSALLNGSADIALLAGPVALNTIKSGAKVVTTGEGLVQGLVVTAVRRPVALNTIKSGAKVVTTGEGLVQGLVVTAVRWDFLEKYPKAVEKFKTINDNIVKTIYNYFDSIVDKVEKEVENTPEEVRTMFPLYDFNPEITENDIKDLKATQEFLIANGLQEKPIDIESIILK